MKYLRSVILLSIVFYTLFPFIAFGGMRDGDKKAIESLVAQMTAAINSRKPYNIKSFFQFYASKEARFVKVTRLIQRGEDQAMIGKEEKIEMNLKEYIEYWNKIIRDADIYHLDTEIQSFQENDSSYVTVNIITKEVVIRSGFNKDDVRITKESHIDTSCNMSFNIGSDIPIIAGSNCIENIIVMPIAGNDKQG